MVNSIYGGVDPYFGVFKCTNTGHFGGGDQLRQSEGRLLNEI